ncbi:hypothetical protein SPRG_08635 [Saprolegnia parasitica CBS 223.65]|uniref:C3H1-type domain-containing protein n=1 Tax=Saprolegnia parasitica (strain CBS 223.65) TaxID=695850 RepID=A0A067CGN2_SAPPC|nr:hypothetical protein SPRG_08635 [Saprolegnia parasitica CBS 223.65]KDO25982.1 hypothetical protein SPRG_08635 [Saprolegnia parasitica CBS 223.65]|eukprot:XP_012203269.1 hypothetical protein SPRG_08635 [Saprolegnia parasitica CBS 223.65]
MGKRTREREEAALLPMAKRLQQSADAIIVKPKAEEDDLEAQIKALEADLGSSSDDDSESSGDEAPAAVVNLSEYQNDTVPSLPGELLPKVSCQSNKVATHKKPKKAVEPAAKVKIVGKVPFACKPCGFIGVDLDDFLAHKKTTAHLEECGQVGFKCKLCVKEFTSADQLAEHKLGKWHLMRVRTKKDKFVVQGPRVCYDFMRGQCSYGDKCSFEHSAKSNATKVCNQFRAGSCRFGDKCIFAHTKE